MRSWLMVAGGLALIAIAGGAVFIYWARSPVEIVVENTAPETARSVRIFDDRGNFSATIESIPAGSFVEVRFPPHGEADYRVEAEFEAGRFTSPSQYTDVSKRFLFQIARPTGP